MTPWIQSTIPVSELKIFERIRRSVQALPDLELGTYEDGTTIIQSCHILAKALGEVFNLPVETGKFCGVSDHSWLKLPSRHIIDVYPVGIIGGPLLVTSAGCSPGQWMYRTRSEIFQHPHVGKPRFEKAVHIVIEELRKL